MLKSNVIFQLKSNIKCKNQMSNFKNQMSNANFETNNQNVWISASIVYWCSVFFMFIWHIGLYDIRWHMVCIQNLANSCKFMEKTEIGWQTEEGPSEFFLWSCRAYLLMILSAASWWAAASQQPRLSKYKSQLSPTTTTSLRSPATQRSQCGQ